MTGGRPQAAASSVPASADRKARPRDDCPICGSRDVRFAERHRDRRKGLSGEWAFWRCSGCSGLFQNPMPTVADLLGYYSIYSPEHRLPFELGVGSRYPALRRAGHWLTGDIDPRDFVPARAGARILDYGCGQAPYLLDFHRRGVDVAGAEIDGDVVRAYRARGFDVRLIEELERIPFDDQSFDTVYLMQVLEHIRNPHAYLAELRRVLKPGGDAFLALPNGNSWCRRRFGSDWVTGWFAPFHLFVHTGESVRLLAAAHGFEVADCWSRTPASWFRLNLKARRRPASNRLESEPVAWIDSLPGRLALGAALRLFELPQRDGDCLVVRLRRAPEGPGTRAPRAVHCVIPVHNRLPCLVRCLSDLRGQDYPDLSIVVVDDGSTDGTAEWIGAQSQPGLTVLRGDGGLWWGGAMRLGMEHVLRTAGPDDYLLMLNDDVFLEPGYVSALVRESERQGGGVVGSLQRSTATGEVLDCGYRIDYLRMTAIPLTDPAEQAPNALPGRGTLYPMPVVRRTGLIRSGVFRHYFGDLEYSARAQARGAWLCVSRDAVIRTDPISSDSPARGPGAISAAFSRRSKSNLFHRAAFFSLAGPRWLRVWAIPRLLVTTAIRGVRRRLAAKP